MNSRAAVLITVLWSAPLTAQARDLSGTYDTRVTVLEQGCPMQVMDNPTEVAHPSGPGSLTLRHAGTTYGGPVDSTGRFDMPPVVVTFGGTSYTLVVRGGIARDTLDARVTITWTADRACRVVVRWRGARTDRAAAHHPTSGIGQGATRPTESARRAPDRGRSDRARRVAALRPAPPPAPAAAAGQSAPGTRRSRVR